jgi:hypothetical protein
MGDLGGEKVCNKANLNLCVHGSSQRGELSCKSPFSRREAASRRVGGFGGIFKKFVKNRMLHSFDA